MENEIIILITSAFEVGEALKDSSIRLIFCSPYVRTIQTASQIAKHKNIKIRLEYGVIEWHGPKQQVITHTFFLINIKVNPRPVAELASMFPGLIDTDYQSIYPLPNYLESKKLLEERSKQIMKKLSERFTGHAKGAIAIVTHAATTVTLTRGILGAPEAEVRCGVCSIGKLRKNSQGQWTQELNGYSSHLSGGEMYHWEFPEDIKRKKKLQQLQETSSTNSMQIQPPDDNNEDED